MALNDVLADLKQLGTAQNRKVYGRHGVGENMYGVSFANLNKLAKQIKTNHELAGKLWATGNHDARVLATMIADPPKMTSRELDAWARDLDNYCLTDCFSGLVSEARHARAKMEKWGKSMAEWTGRAGWLLLAHLARKDSELTDRYLEQQLPTIEREIHSRPNQVRDAMNSALIAIGIRNPRLEKKALAAAKRIGKVEVDHGETSCKTPDAAAYIRKTLERRKNKRRR